MNAAVQHLSNLICIPSPSYLSNRPIIDYAANELRQANWHCREITYRDAAGVEKINLIAAPRHQDLDDATPELALMCHTDTVPYSTDWPRALEPFVADGQLHGCGACDVKGFLACLLVAIAESDSSTLIDGLRLVLTADEEIGCVGAAHLVASGLLKPRRVVIGEPTSLHPARAGKGYCLAEVIVFGQEAHSAHPQRGKSAIYSAARLVSAIEEYGSLLAKEKHPLFSPSFTTLNIARFEVEQQRTSSPANADFSLSGDPFLTKLAIECRKKSWELQTVSETPTQTSGAISRFSDNNLASRLRRRRG